MDLGGTVLTVRRRLDRSSSQPSETAMDGGAVHTILPNGVSLEPELITFKLVDSNLNLALPPTYPVAEKQLLPTQIRIRDQLTALRRIYVRYIQL